MEEIKIVSNPYNQEITYYEKNSENEEWELITNENSNLLSKNLVKGFFPFYVKKIVDEIIGEYQNKQDEESKIVIEFEGTDDEFDELLAVVCDDKYNDKVSIRRSDKRLANARDILPDITSVFKNYLSPIISESISGEKIEIELNKFSDASNDVIPICVVGNYSSGKSTFINSLIGKEILPCGDEPVTAKIYQIKRSNSDEKASLELEYEGDKFKISFKGDDYEIVYTGGEKPLYSILKEKLNEIKDVNITKKMNTAISIINDFDNHKEEITISDLIEIQIPFGKGLLKNSDREFVIFDTPGSNSASDGKHLEVLKAQMRNLSNGLPIYVSEIKLNTNDNADLYKVINSIEELDKRFTMIIVNKADDANLPREGFNSDDIEGILRQEIPRKMYSEGIYFVSSIIGLGSKNDADFIDDHLAEVFDGIEKNYRDPSARFYKSLYKYNIVPEQLKEEYDIKAQEYAEENNEYLFANSGLYSIEDEILTFAGKYSHYNKCKQAQLFLDKVIDNTAEEIERTRKAKESEKKEISNLFEQDKNILIEQLTKKADDLKNQSNIQYFEYMSPLVNEAKVVYTTEQVEELENEFREKQKKEKNYEDFLVEEYKAKVKRSSNFTKNISKIVKNMNLETIRELRSDYREDTENVTKHKESLKGVKHDVDKTASDNLFDKIKNDFTNHANYVQINLEAESRKFWKEKSDELRNSLITIVSGSNALSHDKKDEIKELILSYENLNLDNIAENIFIRNDFERGIWIGKIKIVTSDRLNIRKLVGKYSGKIEEIVDAIINQLNNNHKTSINVWSENLINKIQENIVEYNPTLQEKSKKINELSNKISELEKRQIDLVTYTKNIKDMMDWSSIG